MILIDYSGIVLATVTAQKIPADENLIRHMVLNSIRMYRKKYQAKYGEIVVCCDSRNNWRKAFYPYYKAKRREARKDESSGIQWDEVFRIMALIKEEIREVFSYPVLEVEGAEADDIIGTLARYTQDFGKHEEVMIVSSDKDFVQLQRFRNVSQYSPARKKLLVENSPEVYLTHHILRGDAGDGVPNVLSDDDVFVTENKRQKPLTKKTLSKIIAGDPEICNPLQHNLVRNTKLVSLECTPKPLQQEIISSFEQQRKDECEIHAKRVLDYFIAKQCKLLLDDIEDFV